MKKRIRRFLLTSLVFLSWNISFSYGSSEHYLYRTYLVNKSQSCIEYTIELVNRRILIHSGMLPSEKSCSQKLNYFRKNNRLFNCNLPWVLKLDIPLGEYKICLISAQYGERCFTKKLDKSDYNNSYIPYWEIEDEK
jgi:hypothetical protein